MRRTAIALTILVALVLAVPRLLDPHTWALVEAARELGPVSAWRCARSATYVYDPTHERPDATLLSEAPEAAVLARAPFEEIDRVEANLRGGDTLVTAHATTTDGSDDTRVYVLSPGRLQSVTVDVLGGGETTLCTAHLSDWQIVGEQEL